MHVKKLNFALAAAFAILATAPATAQLTSASMDFIKAVKERNGNKAIDLLNNNPPGLVDARDNDGNTPLIITIARQDGDWVGFFLARGADVDLPGKGGDTPLITAARVGFQDAVESLIAHGAKVDAANRMGETPLIVAVQRREPQIVRVLLNAGANPDKSDSAAGLSARDYAARDARSRQILQLIEAKKPKPSAAR